MTKIPAIKKVELDEWEGPLFITQSEAMKIYSLSKSGFLAFCEEYKIPLLGKGKRGVQIRVSAKKILLAHRLAEKNAQ